MSEHVHPTAAQRNELVATWFEEEAHYANPVDASMHNKRLRDIARLTFAHMTVHGPTPETSTELLQDLADGTVTYDDDE